MYEPELMSLMNAILAAQSEVAAGAQRYYALPPRATPQISVPDIPETSAVPEPPAPTYNITYNMPTPSSSSSSSPPPPPSSQPTPSYTFGIGPAGVPQGASTHITHDTPGFTEWAMQHFSSW